MLSKKIYIFESKKYTVSKSLLISSPHYSQGINIGVNKKYSCFINTCKSLNFSLFFHRCWDHKMLLNKAYISNRSTGNVF